MIVQAFDFVRVYVSYSFFNIDLRWSKFSVTPLRISGIIRFHLNLKRGQKLVEKANNFLLSPTAYSILR